MAHKLTKDEITTKFRAGEIDADEMMRLLADANRKPPRFAVADKSGWLSKNLVRSVKESLLDNSRTARRAPCLR